mmetsp:Transcript_48147/g.114450  ORF Transcript_48147/g.114450 Transcript_48147/m.114450 type:complete len:97 (+) Transcript_48147:302-592(+)
MGEAGDLANLLLFAFSLPPSSSFPTCPLTKADAARNRAGFLGTDGCCEKREGETVSWRCLEGETVLNREGDTGRQREGEGAFLPLAFFLLARGTLS